MWNDEYNPSITSTRITYLLNAQKKTKKAFNFYCGINKDTVNQSATSKNGLSARTLFRAADFFHCPVDYLLGREGYEVDKMGEVAARAPRLPQAESQLLSLFRQLPEIEKYKLLGRLELMAEQNQPKEESV